MMAISHRIRKGMIIFWPFAIADIPSGWVICNGTLGTPDMRNLFPVGAGDTYNPDDTTGTAIHRHTSDFDAHSHSMESGSGIASGATFSSDTSEDELVGFTNYGNNLPPCRALVFIMKL